MAIPDETTTNKGPPTAEETHSQKSPGAEPAGEEAEPVSEDEELPVVETPSSCYISGQTNKENWTREVPHPHVPISSPSAPSAPAAPPGYYLGPPAYPSANLYHPNTDVPIIKVQPYIHGDGTVLSSLVEVESKCGQLLHHWRALLLLLLIVLILTLTLGIGLGVGLSCSGKFHCSSSQVCVRQSARCDGLRDCPDGEDELYCVRVSGRSSVLQVYSRGAWQTVCSTDGNYSSLGSAACRQLGYTSYSTYSTLPLSYVEPFLQTNLVLVNINMITPNQPISIHSPSLLSKTRCSSGNVITLSCLDCGSRPSPGSRIVGGVASLPGQFPWLASLHHQLTPICGAVIITHTWILTAAHCVYGFDDPNQWAVHVGLTAQPINEAGSLTVDGIICHALYRPRRTEYDIALIRLEQSLSFNGVVRPICLPRYGEQLEEGRSCWISGWGATQSGGEASILLHAAQVQVLSNQLCPAPSSPWSLCAGQTHTGPHSCQGDSGSPLVCEGQTVWKVWGVLGWSYGCGESSTGELYTQVLYALPWIHTQMEKEETLKP